MNFKRGKPKEHCRTNRNKKLLRDPDSLYYNHLWMQHHPKWWDVLYHNRPHRIETKRICRNILIGKQCAEDALFPLSKKPHIYFW